MLSRWLQGAADIHAAFQVLYVQKLTGPSRQSHQTRASIVPCHRTVEEAAAQRSTDSCLRSLADRFQGAAVNPGPFGSRAYTLSQRANFLLNHGKHEFVAKAQPIKQWWGPLCGDL